MDEKRKKTLEDYMAAVPEEELTAEKPADTFSLDEPKKSYWIQIILYLVILGIIGGVSYTGYRVYLSQNVIENEKKIEGSIVGDDETKIIPLYVYVDADGGLNLRAEADVGATSLILIPNKTKLEITEEKNDWIKVTYEGQTGWVKKELTLVP